MAENSIKKIKIADTEYVLSASNGIYYIEGSGATGVWTGSHNDIIEYYPGLMIAYKVGIAGASSLTLNINNLGAVPVVRNATTAVTTHYSVGSVLFLVYTVDSGGSAYWKTSDYDSDTKTRSSNKTGSKMYIIGATAQSTSGQTTYSNSNCYIGTDNCLYSGGKKVATAAELTAAIEDITLNNFGITATAAELNYVDGVTSNIQTQLDGKASSDHALNKTGDMMTGPLSFSTVSHGPTLPTSGEEGQIYFLEDNSPALPIGGSAGQVLVKNSSTDGDASWKTNISGNANTATKLATPQTITLTGDVSGSASFTGNTACSMAVTVVSASHTHTWANISDGSSCTINTTGTITGSKVYGAVWNDYAEYRICNDNFIPGQVVCENGDDTLSIAIERMQPGANIISDTFGFAIGETEDAKCPVAVSGRVLAYTYEAREEFRAGDPVCAGPNGTVSKMTREEVKEYPDRMIGTVSAIPNYETWGNENILVNNRIWIKI